MQLAKAQAAIRATTRTSSQHSEPLPLGRAWDSPVRLLTSASLSSTDADQGQQAASAEWTAAPAPVADWVSQERAGGGRSRSHLLAQPCVQTSLPTISNLPRQSFRGLEDPSEQDDPLAPGWLRDDAHSTADVSSTSSYDAGSRWRTRIFDLQVPQRECWQIRL